MMLVRWENVAIQEVSRVWLTANPSLREAIGSAVNQVNEILQEDAQAGESRTRGRRILFVGPLGLTFRPRTG